MMVVLIAQINVLISLSLKNGEFYILCMLVFDYEVVPTGSSVGGLVPS
jgi:hypothetical protein